MIFSDLQAIAVVYFLSLLLSVMGLAGFKNVFKHFPDRGYPFGRVGGILIVSYALWILSYVLKLSVNSVTAWVVTALLLSLTLTFRRNVLPFLRRNYKMILFEEVLFLALFSLMILYRGSNPKIEGIEKFMDFGIINGLTRSEHLPTEDVWFSGSKINYYYFAHFGLSVLNKMARIPSVITYNIFVALIFAITGTCAFSINLLLTKSKVFSLLGSFILIFAGNLDLMVHELTKSGSDYFYANARSLISYTINEFPSYSFVISDLHAHIINIPFVLLLISLVLAAFFDRKLLRSKIFIGLSSLVLGSFGATNSWDLLIYAPFLSLLFILPERKSIDLRNIVRTFIPAAVVMLLALLSFIFFYIDFSPVTNGIGLVKDQVDVSAMLKMFGFFIYCGIIYLFFIYPKHEEDKVKIAIGAVLVYATFLMILPNIIFLKDIYFKLNPPYYRANTFFKVWYQAWILFSLTVAYSSKKLFESLKNSNGFRDLVLSKPHRFLTAVLGVFLLFYILKYPVIAYRYVIGAKYTFQGIDGSEWISEEDPGKKNIVDWLNKNVPGQPVVLEAAGRPYSTDSLVSSYTGLPTVIGWTEHELGWRDNWPEIANRMGDVEKMYQSNSADEIRNLIGRYHVEYVVITSTEYEKYGPEAGRIIKTLSDEKLRSGDSYLLKISH